MRKTYLQVATLKHGRKLFIHCHRKGASVGEEWAATDMGYALVLCNLLCGDGWSQNGN